MYPEHTSDGSLKLPSGWVVVGVDLEGHLAARSIGGLAGGVGVDHILGDEHLCRLSVEVDNPLQLVHPSVQRGHLDGHLSSLSKEVLHTQDKCGLKVFRFGSNV